MRGNCLCFHMPSICLAYTDPFFLHWDCKQLWDVWVDKQMQMPFQCNQPTPTHLPVNWRLNCCRTEWLNVDSAMTTERYLAFNYLSQYLLYKCKMQPYLAVQITDSIGRTSSSCPHAPPTSGWWCEILICMSTHITTPWLCCQVHLEEASLMALWCQACGSGHSRGADGGGRSPSG